MPKLGLIAGGGGLPVEIATACQQAGRPLFVVRLKGFAGPELAAFPGAAGVQEAVPNGSQPRPIGSEISASALGPSMSKSSAL